MAKKQEYSWWDDPANAEKVKEMSWWDHKENKRMFNLPVSVIQEGDSEGDSWTASFNSDTERLFGEVLSGVASGATLEEAITRLFKIVQIDYNYNVEMKFNYQRWVPLIIGPWKFNGGRWFTVFGIHVYFRYGNKMMGGWYIPFTKLNIIVNNEWRSYNRWIKKHKTEDNE